MAKYNKSSNKKRVLFFLICAFLVIVLANLIPKIQVYIKRPEASALVSFPKDHASHPSFKAEWWYLNILTKTTNLNGASPKDTGYLLSFSRILNSNGLLSSRYDKLSNSFSEKTDIGGNLKAHLIDNKYLYISYSNKQDNVILREVPSGADRKRVYKLTGKTPQMGNFDLTLKERSVPGKGFTKPLLWGGTTGNCQGKISVFSANDTFYYSIPDLDITGNITDINGGQRIVKSGKAWIDHQWFNSTPPSNWKGHYWNSFHFTESAGMYDSGPHQGIGFITQMYSDGANTTPKYTYWVKRNADGSNQCGTEGNITINNYGSTNYPSSWTFKLKKSGNQFLQVTGSSFSDNQVFTPPYLPKFFEPASYITGTLNGKPITGLGFFETHLTKPQ